MVLTKVSGGGDSETVESWWPVDHDDLCLKSSNRGAFKIKSKIQEREMPKVSKQWIDWRAVEGINSEGLHDATDIGGWPIVFGEKLAAWG